MNTALHGAAQLTLTLGRDRPSGATFTRVLGLVLDSLEHVTDLARERPYTSLPKWVIDDVAHQHDAVAVTLGQAPAASRPARLAFDPATLLTTTVQDLAGAPSVPEALDVGVIETIGDAARVARLDGGLPVHIVALNGRREEASYTPAVENNAAAVLGGEQALDSVDGLLVALRWSEKKGATTGTLRVRDGWGSRQVRVVATTAGLGQQLQAMKVGSWVSAFGLAQYDHVGHLVRTLYAERLQVLPTPEERKGMSVLELLGSTPNVTGGRSVEEHLGWLRG